MGCSDIRVAFNPYVTDLNISCGTFHNSIQVMATSEQPSVSAQKVGLGPDIRKENSLRTILKVCRRIKAMFRFSRAKNFHSNLDVTLSPSLFSKLRNKCGYDSASAGIGSTCKSRSSLIAKSNRKQSIWLRLTEVVSLMLLDL